MNKFADVPRIARKNLESGMNCSEAILSAFLEAMGEDKELMRMATPFGAGVGCMRDLCGILTGGQMAVGLRFGRQNEADLQIKEKCYEAAADFYRWFETNFKCRCSEIITENFSGHTNKCLDIIEKSAEKIAQLILQ